MGTVRRPRGGDVSERRRVFLGVPNTFQIEIYFDGTISLNYLTVSITDGLVGLSDGGGVDPDFMESDLSTMLACGEYPPIAYDSQATVDGGVATLVPLSADDDGFPNPPGMLSYIITALPQNGALSDPGAGQITSVPYTLSGGTQVQYYSSPYYVGPDSFQFQGERRRRGRTTVVTRTWRRFR